MENKSTILKMQATLVKIKTNKPCFFNLTQYLSYGLIRENGKTHDNKTNWVLTDKANAILNVMV